MNITVGSQVSIEIVKKPLRESARKTLLRVCEKDPSVAKQTRQRKEKRPSLTGKRRGGRIWAHRMETRPTATIERGRRYTVRATLDVIRDLESIGDSIKVSAV